MKKSKSLGACFTPLTRLVMGLGIHDVATAREEFSRAHSFLRQARNTFYEVQGRVVLLRLRRASGDHAKRRKLRAMAEELRDAGLYSKRIPISAVEHMVLSRLYFYYGEESGHDPGDFRAWKSFADTHAGPSYFKGIPFRDLTPRAK